MQKIRDSAKRYLYLTVAISGFYLGFVPSDFADVINLGGAAAYAVVAVGGSPAIQSEFKLYQSDTVINGNVAEGPYTTLGHVIDATVNGRWDYDVTDDNPLVDYPGSNIPSGGFHQIDLSGVAADARAAALTGSLFAPTQTFSSLSNGQTIMGNGGLNVIRVTGDSAISGGSSTFTLQGTASDSFVFQFTAVDAPSAHQLTLSGVTMNITGVNTNNIYWDFNGLGGNLQITSGATVYGNFLAPDRAITVDHGNILGRVIGGGSGTLLDIHSSSQITVPEPGVATFLLLGMALLGLGLVRSRKTTG